MIPSLKNYSNVRPLSIIEEQNFPTLDVIDKNETLEEQIKLMSTNGHINAFCDVLREELQSREMLDRATGLIVSGTLSETQQGRSAVHLKQSSIK